MRWEHEPIVNHLTQLSCSYCNQEIEREQWVSAWGSTESQHYKTMQCSSCRRVNWLKVDFEGSGHDSFLKQKESFLESALKKDKNR